MAKASVLDRIRELDEERKRLLDEAKATALANAEKAIEELNELGFNYQLVQRDGTTSRAPRQSTGTRRTGVRQEVLNIVTNNPNGIKRADVLQQMGATDKRDQQSISNALANLKKSGAISGEGGMYQPATPSSIEG